MLNIDYIKKHIDKEYDIDIEVRESVSSTNTVLKEEAQNSTEKKAKLLIAQRQTSGKGTKGRSFYSPHSSGIYMSLLLHPELSPADSLSLTTAAAVAVCNSIKKVCSVECDIKWVNDVYKDGKKICGILCESSIDGEGQLEYAIIGVGINIIEPAGGFPSEIANKAGAIYQCGTSLPGLIREEIACIFVNEYLSLINSIDSDRIFENYSEHLFITGKEVNVIKGDSVTKARVIKLNRDFSLKVSYDGISFEDLSHGEITLLV